MQPTLKFEYKNWKGEVSIRTVDHNDIQFWFGSTEYHTKPQYLLRAFDLDKQAERDFAVRDILRFL